MKVTIHSNSGLEVTKSMRNYIDISLKRLLEVVPNDATIACSCKVTNKLQGFEITIYSKESTVRAESYCDNFYDSVSKSVDKAIASARKMHNKLLDIKRRKNRKGDISFNELEQEMEELNLVREKEISAAAMSTESALLQLEALNRDFFLYLNSKTLLPCVVYKRNDGGYGKLTLKSI